jgi:hypothetical protein
LNSASVYSRAVRKAAEMLGGRENLARALQVPLSEVEKWLLEQKKPPREVFLRVVDILIEDSAGSDDPAGDPPSGRDATGESRAEMFD